MPPAVERSLLWRRLDVPGHEAGRLLRLAQGWQLSGTAVFLEQGLACQLDYGVQCDDAWRTLSARVVGWQGERSVELEVFARGERWWLNGSECPGVAGCLDVDLSFSPSTNLLPLRRLGLRVGEQASVLSAWLSFPECVLEPLHQVYRRTAESTYWYEAAAGAFKGELVVDGSGMVIRYSGLWERERGEAAE